MLVAHSDRQQPSLVDREVRALSGALSLAHPASPKMVLWHTSEICDAKSTIPLKESTDGLKAAGSQGVPLTGQAAFDAAAWGGERRLAGRSAVAAATDTPSNADHSPSHEATTFSALYTPTGCEKACFLRASQGEIIRSNRSETRKASSFTSSYAPLEPRKPHRGPIGCLQPLQRAGGAV